MIERLVAIKNFNKTVNKSFVILGIKAKQMRPDGRPIFVNTVLTLTAAGPLCKPQLK